MFIVLLGVSHFFYCNTTRQLEVLFVYVFSSITQNKRLKGTFSYCIQTIVHSSASVSNTY